GRRAPRRRARRPDRSRVAAVRTRRARRAPAPRGRARGLRSRAPSPRSRRTARAGRQRRRDGSTAASSACPARIGIRIVARTAFTFGRVRSVGYRRRHAHPCLPRDPLATSRSRRTPQEPPLNFAKLPELLRLRRLRAFRRRRAAQRARREPEPALRAELFSAEQMERHGRTLAAQHRLSPDRHADLLLARLADNEAVLIHACERLTPATRQGRRITPAAEWLLDNFYLVEEQVRIARRHLPKGYSRELPRLAHGPSAALPRVYDIAQEVIAHGDGRVDIAGLRRFVNAYQAVAPLKLGELWAIPIMLRLALIENLRRVAARVIADWRDRGKAARWADKLTAAAERDPAGVVLVVADMARAGPPMSGPFVAELSRRLQGQGPALALPLGWIEQRLAQSGLSVEQLVQLEAQQQAASQ